MRPVGPEVNVWVIRSIMKGDGDLGGEKEEEKKRFTERVDDKVVNEKGKRPPTSLSLGISTFEMCRT